MSKTLFRIENGKFGLSIVDTAAVGYDPSWQTPDDVGLPDVRLSDYDAGTTPAFACQIVTGVLTATENVTTETVDGTWCDPPEARQIVGEDTFAVEWDLYQDPTVADGLSSFLYEHRGERAFVYFGAGGDGVPPTAVGVVTLKAASIGGGRGNARAQVSFPFDRAPDIQFGTTADWRIVYGDKATPPLDGGTPPALAADEPEPADEPAAV